MKLEKCRKMQKKSQDGIFSAWDGHPDQDTVENFTTAWTMKQAMVSSLCHQTDLT